MKNYSQDVKINYMKAGILPSSIITNYLQNGTLYIFKDN